jgi:large subunit ribosomal protein L23
MTIILRPLVNEKSVSLAKSKFYTFEVAKDATKLQVAKEVKLKFKVDVLSVNTINLPRKRKLQRTRKGYYSTSGTRKAIVQIGKDQKIAIFESLSKIEDEVEVKTAESEGPKVKEKKSLFGRTKIRVEEQQEEDTAKAVEDKGRSRQQSGKTKGGSPSK